MFLNVILYFGDTTESYLIKLTSFKIKQSNFEIVNIIQNYFYLNLCDAYIYIYNYKLHCRFTPFIKVNYSQPTHKFP